MNISKPALYSHYFNVILPDLQKQIGCKSNMAVPRLTKISLNMGVGKAAIDRKVLDVAVADLTSIAGQKAVLTYARDSVASFKIRKGWPIGCRVTLRGKRMYEFLNELITVVLPRKRDFRGYSARSFDGTGNYSFGIDEHIIFPEIKFEQVTTVTGLDVTIGTTSKSDKHAYMLLKAFGFPFRETDING